MSGKKRSPRAFTLIELLVVVAIMTLLILLLMPFLARAIELTRRATCMSNVRNLTEAVNGFAASHNGRAPGWALITIGNYSSVAWCDILNAEYYGSNVALRGIWQWPLPKGYIICPDAKLYGQRWYTCMYQFNSAATGGGGTEGSGDGNYAQYVNPSIIQPVYTSFWRSSGGPVGDGLGYYYLGARIEQFKRPNYTYMFIESEHADPDIGTNWPYNPPSAVMNGGTNPAYPPWGACGAAGTGYDFYGFRHTLPNDFSLYQTNATAVFGFMDGHVDVLNPNMDLNLIERFDSINY